jgi:hypothetical protein
MGISTPAHSEMAPVTADSPPIATPSDVVPPDTSTDSGATVTTANSSKTSSALSQASALTGSGEPGNPGVQLTISNSPFTGSAATRVPIEVPPGRGGIAPNLALTYNSQAGNGWVGVGWNLDMGAIQRSTKFGVDYNKSDFMATANGSSAELVARGEWGPNYYGAKIEGAFLKYFYNVSTGGWEVTAKNGTIYYYGSTKSSRQDDMNGIKIFKWCLDKVQDLNGNYMTISYVKDSGEITAVRLRTE